MSGRWDPTPDQYDGPVVRPPTRIVVAGEPMDWERLVTDAGVGDYIEIYKVHPSRWQRAKARIAALRMSW